MLYCNQHLNCKTFQTLKLRPANEKPPDAYFFVEHWISMGTRFTAFPPHILVPIVTNPKLEIQKLDEEYVEQPLC